jgi:uncharacterized membrane protein (DUF373 family)
MIETREPIMARIGARFETIVIAIIQVLLMLTIALTVIALVWLLTSRTVARIGAVETLPELQPLVLRAFAGVLLVLLGLELLESLRTFFVEHRVRLEVILIVATIAVGRHIILLDVEHTSGLSLLGVASVVLALTSGYALVKKSQQRSEEAPMTNSSSGSKS